MSPTGLPCTSDRLHSERVERQRGNYPIVWERGWGAASRVQSVSEGKESLGNESRET